MTNKYFYHHLDSFDRFENIFNKPHFQPIPKDWIVIITDIKSSTRAIDEGRYKDVNMIGAASIVIAHNVMSDFSFPYVFGGDGATIIIPPEYQEFMEHELAGLQQFSQHHFQLGLRIGKIAVQEVLNDGGIINVAKYALTPEKSIALFRGGGLNLAEKKIKSDEKKYCIKPKLAHLPDLEKLSCRWNPVPSKKGKILSLIIFSREQSNAFLYHRILSRFKTIFSGDLDSANPIKESQLSYKGLIDCINSEKALYDEFLSKTFIKRLILTLLSVFTFKFDLLKHYRQSLSRHSDYRKFDDMLRMVVDCNPEQITLINDYLSILYQQGRIYYGIHASEHALMTCFVDSTHEGEHIHFIDGGDGGYAMAAKQLKKQLKETPITS